MEQLLNDFGVYDHRTNQLCINLPNKSRDMYEKELAHVIPFCSGGIFSGKTSTIYVISKHNIMDYLSMITFDANFSIWRDIFSDLCCETVSFDPMIVKRNRPDALLPSKSRVSDSGYDLTLVEHVKTVGNVEFYDTGISVEPPFGWYFDLIGRSSITKSGYILANSVGVIDRSYTGNVIVALIKINQFAKDLCLPSKLVQIIPRRIVHLDVIEKNCLTVTSRGAGGFGSTL